MVDAQSLQKCKTVFAAASTLSNLGTSLQQMDLSPTGCEIYSNRQLVSEHRMSRVKIVELPFHASSRRRATPLKF